MSSRRRKPKMPKDRWIQYCDTQYLDALARGLRKPVIILGDCRDASVQSFGARCGVPIPDDGEFGIAVIALEDEDTRPFFGYEVEVAPGYYLAVMLHQGDYRTRQHQIPTVNPGEN